MLYIIIITLLFYRLVFFPLAPGELSPLTWISMGAAAITTLSGARLLASAHEWAFLAGMEPFLKGYTLFFWSSATWWIPLLVVLGLWRHPVRGFPLRYEPQYWGMVFPLGMYTACTFVLARATGLSFLEWIPSIFSGLPWLPGLRSLRGCSSPLAAASAPCVLCAPKETEDEPFP